MKLPVDGFIFDLDGTVYLGETVLPGAAQGITELRQRGKRILFVSNKPLYPRGVYAEKLTRMGIPTRADEVITSAFVLGHHLASALPYLRLYVVGEQQLRDELRSYGLQVLDELADQDPKEVIHPRDIDAVVVAFDRTLDYRKLNTAYQALRRGARFFATNPDKICPMPEGGIPDAGATIAALEHISGRRVELVAGKPSPLTVAVALDLLRLPPERCMMVGDRLETDIKMGQESGLMTAVVLTGVSTLEDVTHLPTPPNLVIDNLGALPDLVL